MNDKRAEILLRAAWDIFKRCDSSFYVLHAPSVCAYYDEANCDGLCLMDEIAEFLNLPENTQPIPLSDEERQTR